MLLGKYELSDTFTLEQDFIKIQLTRISVDYAFCHASRMCIGDYMNVSCYIVSIVFM